MTRCSPLVLFVVSPLALAACSGQPAPVETATDTASAAPIAPVAPASSETPSAAPANDIPLAARGRWGLVPADCTSTRGDAKGLLTIGATTLKYYESLGKLGAVKERSDTRLRASFAFSGEGMDWSRDEVLDVQDGGKTLIERQYGEGAIPGPLKYTRC